MSGPLATGQPVPAHPAAGITLLMMLLSFAVCLHDREVNAGHLCRTRDTKQQRTTILLVAFQL